MNEHAPPHGGGSDGGVQEKAQEAVAQAQEKAQEAAAKGGDRVREQVDTRTTEYGEQAQSLAQALRRSAADLDHDGARSLVHQVADRVESFGGYLKDADADELLGRAETFARRRPWVAGGAGMVAGFLASRFLKASSNDRYDTAHGKELAVRRDADAPMLREREETVVGPSGRGGF